MTEYTKLLKHPKWQKKRLKILERDEFKCRLCQDKETTLHVHHLKYNKGEPWEGEDENLLTLCEQCHDAIHFSGVNSEEITMIMKSGILSRAETKRDCELFWARVCLKKFGLMKKII